MPFPIGVKSPDILLTRNAENRWNIHDLFKTRPAKTRIALNECLISDAKISVADELEIFDGIDLSRLGLFVQRQPDKRYQLSASGISSIDGARINITLLTGHGEQRPQLRIQ